MSSDVSFTLCSGSYMSQEANTFDHSWLSSTRSDFKRLYAEDEEGEDPEDHHDDRVVALDPKPRIRLLAAEGEGKAALEGLAHGFYIVKVTAADGTVNAFSIAR